MIESLGGPPFAGELKERTGIIEGAFTTVKEFVDDPRWIVKEVNNLDPDQYETQANGPVSFELFKEQVGKSRDMVVESETLMKNFIPQNFLVYGKNETGEEKGFIVMRRIEGDELIKVAEITDEHSRQLDTLVDASPDFYLETKKNLPLGHKFDFEIGYFPDLVSTKTGKDDVPSYLTNIMVGRKIEDGEEKVYFTDIYPLVRIIDGKEDKYWIPLKQALENTEAKFGRGIFIESKEKLSRILNPEKD